MAKKKQLRFDPHRSLRGKEERAWPFVKRAFDREWIPILLALESKETPKEIKDSLRNYIIISMVSTIEKKLRQLAAKNIDAFDLSVANLVEGTITIPLSAIDVIAKGKVTRGSLIAANFSFANPREINFFFSRLLGIKFFDTIRELDYLDPYNYVKHAANLNRNWDNFMEMFDTRNIIVHEKYQVELSNSQIKSLVNCTLNFLDAAVTVGSYDMKEKVDEHIEVLRTTSKRRWKPS